jgi:hypothetical protein
VPLYRRSYDAAGNPTGSVEYTFGRAPRKRIGCLGWTLVILIAGFVLLWPLDLQPRVLSVGEAWAVTVGWWCLLAMVPVSVWLLPKLRERGRQGEAVRRAQEARGRRLAGRPDVDLREVGQDGL